MQCKRIVGTLLSRCRPDGTKLSDGLLEQLLKKNLSLQKTPSMQKETAFHESVSISLWPEFLQKFAAIFVKLFHKMTKFVRKCHNQHIAKLLPY